jgi:foldase protein PrsA
MNHKATNILVSLFVSLCLCGFQNSPDTRVIASTKDWSITAQQLQQFLELLPDQQHQYFMSHQREFLDQLIRIWVMAADARAQGFDKDPKLKATVDFYSNNLLAGEMHRQQVGGSKTAADEAVEQYYEKNKSEFRRIRVSHILALNAGNPDSKKRLEEAKQKLRSGAKFEDVAKQYSQDRESAPNGGDIGYMSKGQMPPELEAVAFELKEGESSDIIQSSVGLHILRVTDVKVAPLSEVRVEIRQKLDADAFDTLVKSRINAANVKIDESFFRN